MSLDAMSLVNLSLDNQEIRAFLLECNKKSGQELKDYVKGEFEKNQGLIDAIGRERTRQNRALAGAGGYIDDRAKIIRDALGVVIAQQDQLAFLMKMENKSATAQGKIFDDFLKIGYSVPTDIGNSTVQRLVNNFMLAKQLESLKQGVVLTRNEDNEDGHLDLLFKRCVDAIKEKPHAVHTDAVKEVLVKIYKHAKNTNNKDIKAKVEAFAEKIGLPSMKAEVKKEKQQPPDLQAPIREKSAQEKKDREVARGEEMKSDPDPVEAGAAPPKPKVIELTANQKTIETIKANLNKVPPVVADKVIDITSAKNLLKAIEDYPKTKPSEDSKVKELHSYYEQRIIGAVDLMSKRELTSAQQAGIIKTVADEISRQSVKEETKVKSAKPAMPLSEDEVKALKAFIVLGKGYRAPLDAEIGPVERALAFIDKYEKTPNVKDRSEDLQKEWQEIREVIEAQVITAYRDAIIKQPTVERYKKRLPQIIDFIHQMDFHVGRSSVDPRLNRGAGYAIRPAALPEEKQQEKEGATTTSPVSAAPPIPLTSYVPVDIGKSKKSEEELNADNMASKLAEANKENEERLKEIQAENKKQADASRSVAPPLTVTSVRREPPTVSPRRPPPSTVTSTSPLPTPDIGKMGLPPAPPPPDAVVSPIPDARSKVAGSSSMPAPMQSLPEPSEPTAVVTHSETSSAIMDDQGHITVQAGTIESASSTQLEEEAEEAPDISKFIEVKYKGKKVSVDAYLEKKMSEFNLDEDSKVTMRKAFKDKRSLECIPPKGTWDDGNYTPQERMEFVQRYINTSIMIAAGGFARDNNKDLAFKVITSIENEFKDTKLLVSKKLSKEQIAAAAAVAAVITQSTEGTIDATKGKPFQAIRDFINEHSPNAGLRAFALPMILNTLGRTMQYDFPEKLGNITDVKVAIGKKQAVLNTYEEKPASFATRDPKDQKFIIHFCGNNQFAGEKMMGSEEYKIEGASKNVERFDCGVITFDYPGVGKSSDVKATKTKHLVKAGIAQVERLLKQGVKPENIVLDGISLGGAVATLTAAHFHNLKPPQGPVRVRLINERSFGKLSSEAAAMASHVLTGKLAVLIPFVSPLIKLTGMEMDAAKAYKSIPDEFKTCLFADKDEVIPYKVSLAKAVGVKKVNPDKCLENCEHGTDLSTVKNKSGVYGDLLKVQLLAKALQQEPNLEKAPVPSSVAAPAPVEDPIVKEKAAPLSKEPGVLDQVKRKIVRKIIGIKDPDKHKHHEKLATERVEKKLEIHEDKAEAKPKSKRPEGVTRLDLSRITDAPPAPPSGREGLPPAPPSARGEPPKTVIPEIVVTPPTPHDARPEAVVPAERTKLRGKEFVALREKQEEGEEAKLKTENVRKDHKKP